MSLYSNCIWLLSGHWFILSDFLMGTWGFIPTCSQFKILYTIYYTPSVIGCWLCCVAFLCLVWQLVFKLLTEVAPIWFFVLIRYEHVHVITIFLTHQLNWSYVPFSKINKCFIVCIRSKFYMGVTFYVLNSIFAVHILV